MLSKWLGNEHRNQQVGGSKPQVTSFCRIFATLVRVLRPRTRWGSRAVFLLCLVPGSTPRFLSHIGYPALFSSSSSVFINLGGFPACSAISHGFSLVFGWFTVDRPKKAECLLALEIGIDTNIYCSSQDSRK